MRCLGRTETDRKITNEPLVVEAQFNGTDKTTLRSEGRSALKKLKKQQKKSKKDLTRAGILRDASLALPTSGSTLPFADFCDMVKVNRFTFSHESVTCRRSPEVSLTAFNAQPPDLQPVPLMDTDFAVICPLVRHRMPQIQFLYIGSRLCSTLLSGPASRRVLFHPCASLSLHVHHVVKRTFTSKRSNMLGTQKKGA